VPRRPALLAGRAAAGNHSEYVERAGLLPGAAVLFATHAYAASKGAIISMSRAMAAYYASHKIRVNVIAPALVRTPMSARAQSNEELLDFIAHKQPLSAGMLDAADIAGTALFLLGDQSRHMTGQVVSVGRRLDRLMRLRTTVIGSYPFQAGSSSSRCTWTSSARTTWPKRWTTPLPPRCTTRWAPDST